ncbi:MULTISPECIES: aminotransferase class I/II-fold pyridoxal phosphate-dependent enzyme [Halomicrobium]|uniref:8-amino-7-oxononanoate synthase n=2 Tax=Halomicrobium mukohataei TaxID=57705 RepID=C7NXH2_HALMD|nr:MULTISPECIES: 8-amino-7-oxononanoate synthase [Halomicrobium]ACV48406.1 8-amino-7-oxononanoate synthase [Halomicrobium mukohataei DSM 12286]QCD66814.1 8-amino-7-oxononanoate synthase [Halomicrobium mukohataei]QFR21624.1 aminotransferase class I/II-fold pyridoxal phosphate-dependent enzyme [Halomicrobium sp. ZPS1]
MTHGFSLGRRLEQREERGLRRHLNPAESVAGRTRLADDPGGGTADFGEPELVFAANNYLGLADDGRVQRAAETAARSIGTGAGASRLVTGDTTLHRALERDLADSKGTERALVFSSGYAANVGVIDALDPDVVFSDELNHASIVDGCRIGADETVVYDHCDPADLARRMDARSGDADSESWLVLTDSVFSMDGDRAPLSDICDAAERHGAWVMVDEAHATGVVGADGGGVVQAQGVSDRIDVQLGTLSKALAAQGGYVAGAETLIEFLLNEARTFVFSTGLAPPAAGAAREALRIAREGTRRERLWENVERLRDGLEAAGFEVLGDTHILPVVVGHRDDAMALATAVRDRGIVAPAIRPPTVPAGRSRLRIAPMATHDEAAIDRCLDAFERAGTECGLL